MRTSAFKVALAFSVCLPCYGVDLSSYESTCLEIGFKKKTPAFGECVLELDRRSNDEQKELRLKQVEQQRLSEQRKAAQEAQIAAQRGDGTPDHQTCHKFGFVVGTPAYSDCRLKINLARREQAQRQQQYEADMRRYEQEQREYQEKLAAYQRERERQKGLAALQFGAALAAGRSPYFSENFGNAGRSVLGLPPVAPTAPSIQSFSITRPGVPMTNCTVFGNMINCN